MIYHLIFLSLTKFTGFAFVKVLRASWRVLLTRQHWMCQFARPVRSQTSTYTRYQQQLQLWQNAASTLQTGIKCANCNILPVELSTRARSGPAGWEKTRFAASQRWTLGRQCQMVSCSYGTGSTPPIWIGFDICLCFVYKNRPVSRPHFCPLKRKSK